MTLSIRNYSLLDELCDQFDKGLRTVFSQSKAARRERPDQGITENNALNDKERVRVGRLMRINHTGEICAQALYQGQAITAKSKKVKQQLESAAHEENDHLSWCEQRLDELNTQVSYLNPFFYVASLSMGMVAGIIGDRWSLGFLAETERQVETHLETHIKQLPTSDNKTRIILKQMKEDECSHATTAVTAGASELPVMIKKAMAIFSKVMTKTTYWI